MVRMSDHYDVLIVGGGQGGAAAAMALRHNGFAGTIAIAGAEPELPYDRPPPRSAVRSRSAVPRL